MAITEEKTARLAAYQLQKAADNGKLEDKHDYTYRATRIHLQKPQCEQKWKALRYAAPMQTFFEVILL